MRNPERIIFVPLGDKTHENLERAASFEAWKLSWDILEEENSRESLGCLLYRFNPVYYLKKGIMAVGGYLVKIEKMKTS